MTSGQSGPPSSLRYATLEPAILRALDDRLRLRAPGGVQFAQRTVGGLMGMKISRRREHQLWIYRAAAWGQARVLVQTLDPFSLVGESFLSLGVRVLNRLPTWTGCACTIDPTGVDSKCLIVVANQLEPTRTDILVAQALVPHADGTVLLANFITDRATAKNDEAGVFSLTRAIAETLHDGDRALETRARNQRFGSDAAPEGLTIALPAGFVWDTDEGADFVVHTCQYVVGLDATPFAFKIYIGDHPSGHYDDDVPPTARVSSPTSCVLGQTTTWRQIDADGLVSQETICPVSVGGRRRWMHVFGQTDTVAQAQYTRDLVSTIREG